MHSIRAYNMNINDMIHTGNNQNEVDAGNDVSSDKQKLLKTANDTLSDHAVDNGSVQVDISPVWQEVAGTIDVKNATADEVADLSSTLFKAGAISFEDHVSLSFSKNEQSDEKVNFVEYWNDRQEDAVIQGAAHEDLNDIIRIQSILGYVDSLK